MTNDERKELETHFWRYLWSSIIITLSGCLGNVVDGIIVGNLIGADGVSAINYSKPVVQLMMTLSLLLAAGGSMLVGFALGKQDFVRMRYVYTHATISNFVVSLVFVLVGLVAPTATASLLCNDGHLLQPTLEYLRPMLYGAPSYMMMWTISLMIGVDGSPRLSSVAIVIDNAVNLVLDLVFIQLLGWGLTGSSTATVVGHLVGITIMLLHYRRADNRLHFSFRHDAPEGRNIISQGTPLALASVCLTLLLFSANSIVTGTMGRSGIFAFAVCMNLLQVYNLFLAGTCRTLQSLGAIQAGKGDNDAFRLVLRKSFRFITVAMIATCLLVWVDPQLIASLFGSGAYGYTDETVHALRIFSISFIPFCYIYVLMIVYKLYGHHRMALFISLILSLTVIPVLWLMSRMALDYFWYSYLIAYGIEAVVIVLVHKRWHLQFSFVQKK
mgnify:FL=1